MTRSIEVEMKFEILAPDQIETFLKTLTFVGEKRVADTYLDTPKGDLFKRGIFIRIRDGKKLDFKFNADDIAQSTNEHTQHLHCDEISLSLPLTTEELPQLNETLQTLGMKPVEVPTVEDLLARNNLTKSMTIDKRRRSYVGNEFNIDVDSVQGLGEYLEIEKMTDEHDDSARIQAAMQRFLAGLDLHYVDTGYNELYWRKHNFELYLQGKYLLPEDRKKYQSQHAEA